MSYQLNYNNVISLWFSTTPTKFHSFWSYRLWLSAPPPPPPPPPSSPTLGSRHPQKAQLGPLGLSLITAWMELLKLDRVSFLWCSGYIMWNLVKFKRNKDYIFRFLRSVKGSFEQLVRLQLRQRLLKLAFCFSLFFWFFIYLFLMFLVDRTAKPG